MARRQLRLGIIGAGLAVKWLHWPTLARMKDRFKIVAVCDIDDATAGEVSRMAGLDSWTSDYREVLADDNVEAVLLSLPIHLNADLMLAAARAGKHVLCEKPLAASLEQGRELVQTLRHMPVVVEIAENFHYREDIIQARRWIDEGRIGELVAVRIEARFWTDTTQGFGATRWRQDHQYRGSVLADAGVHHAAALRELGGEVEQLHAFVKDVHPVTGGHDTIMINLRYRNGALGQLFFAAASRTHQPGFAEMLVLGREGSVLIEDGIVRLHRPGSEEEVVSIADFDGGYYGEFRNFYEAVVASKPVVATPEEALRDLTIVMRALDAAESRAVVLL